MKCAVAKCLENNCIQAARGKTISFYSFPKDTAQRKHWEMFCNREDTINFKNERICSLHFKQVDFERNLKYEMGYSSRSARKLNPGAVPSIEPSAIAKPCVEKTTPITTDSKEDNLQPATLNKDEVIHGQQLYIKTLESKIDALRQENDMLKLTQTKSAIVTQNLSSDVQSLTLKIKNLEKSLRRLFTQSQIKKLQAGNKRLNFTQEDIKQSITLYATSAKAYRFLKKKHFPLPSVRTLQRWSQKYVSTGMSQKPKISVISIDKMK